MRLDTLLMVPALALALGACTARAPEPEEPAGPANGSFTASLNGFQIHYEVHGQGPVLMTLPNSWGLSLEGLRAMYRPLEERLTLVYFDPRGMGESEAIREDSDRGMAAVRADFQALRAHLGLEQANVIGWSNGAINLIYLAHEQPETLSSAIFLHGAASSSGGDEKAFQEEHPQLAAAFASFLEEMADPELSAEDKTARFRQMALEEYFPTLCADPEAGKAMLLDVFRDADFSWPHAAYDQQEEGTFDARDLLPEIPVRSLVIAGAHDLFPPDRVKVLHDGLPDSDFVVFEKSGHFAPVEEPAAFAAVVFNFLGVWLPPTS